jgi:hypothetical protein
MNQKLAAHFEVEKNSRNYVFIVPNDAPLGEVYDVLHEMLTATVEMSKQAAERVKQTPPSPEVQAEVV